MTTLPFSATFSDLGAVHAEMHRLSRLALLSKRLGSVFPERSVRESDLQLVAVELIERAGSLNHKDPFPLNSLRTEFPKNMRVPYFGSMVETVSLDKVREVAQNILTDIRSIQVTPIKSPKLGQHGPTFLVDYPIETKHSSSTQYCAYVIKNSSALEVVSNRIYAEFANCRKGTGQGVPCFSAPQTELVDLGQKKYFPSSGDSFGIDDVAKLSKSFNQISLAMEMPNCFAAGKIMLAEKIQGQNILDFISSAYQETSAQQKKEFFCNLGKISLLDLLMGNLERFLAVDLQTPELLSAEIAANLGNALIVLSGNETGNEGVFLYAIDNGISPFLCMSSDSRLDWTCKSASEAYNQLVTRIISSPEGLEELVSNIHLSLIACGKTASPMKDRRMLNSLKPFLADFINSKPLYLGHIREGILEMGLYIKEHIIPFWKGPESCGLKGFIRSNCDIVLDPLDERINIFDNDYTLHTL